METHNQQGAGTRRASRKFALSVTLRGNGNEAARELAARTEHEPKRGRGVFDGEVAREVLDVVDMEDARCDAMALWAQPAEPWKPENGELVFYLVTYGTVFEVDFDSDDFMDDTKRLEFGNCFKTRAEAEAARERVRAALQGQTVSETEKVESLDGKPLTAFERIFIRDLRDRSAAGEAFFFAAVTPNEALLLRDLRAKGGAR